MYELYCNTGEKVTDQHVISAYNAQSHAKEPNYVAQTGEMSGACTHHN